MKRFIIQADEELIERARGEAQRRGVSIAQVVRDALQRELGPAKRPRTKLIGAFRSAAPTDARELSEAGRVPPRSWR
jgi:hypothetical protein